MFPGFVGRQCHLDTNETANREHECSQGHGASITLVFRDLSEWAGPSLANGTG